MKRKTVTRDLLVNCDDPTEFVTTLHQDYKHNVRNSFDNFQDNDYIVSLYINGFSILIYWFVEFQSFELNSIWLQFGISLAIGALCGILMGIIVNLITNGIHNQVFVMLKESEHPMAIAIAESWKVTHDKLKFNVKDADFSTLFELEDLTVDKVARMTMAVDLDRREKMLKVLQRVNDPRAAEAMCRFLELNPVTNSIAVKTLVRAGKKALSPLKELLSSNNNKVKIAAMAVLSGIKEEFAIEILVSMLKDENDEVRRAAIWDLNENSHRWTESVYAGSAVQILKKELKDSDPLKRAFAAWALGMMKESSSADLLIERFENDESSGVKEASAFALGELHSQKAYISLENAIQHEDAAVRNSAFTAMMKINKEKTVSLKREE